MIKRVIVICLFLFPILKASAGNINIELLRDCSIALEPGQHCTFAFKVSNSGSSPVNLSPEFNIPAGWTCICPDTSFFIGPGEISIRLMTIIIPMRIPSGSYNFSYILSIKETGEIVLLTREIKVREKAGIAVKSIDAPSYILAGEPFYTTFLVKNMSNSAQRISLVSRNAQITGDSVLQLPADASAEVKLLTNTDKNIPATQNEIITLEARLSGSLDNDLQKRSFGNEFIKVIPLREKQSDRFYQLPVDVKIVSLGKQTGTGKILSGWQGEIYGKGYLAPFSSQQLEFRFRGPDQFQISPLGMTEEYFISYSSGIISAFAGDKTFSLTPLTEQCRFGRGAEFSFTKGNTSWGAFYANARYTPFVKNEQAVYGSFRWKNESFVTTSFLRKITSDESDPANLFSVMAGSTFFKVLKVNAEMATGYRDNKNGSSLRVDLQGEISKFNISGQYIYADASYPGYYSNSRIANVTAWMAVCSKISTSVTINHDDQNAALDTLLGTAPASENYLASIIYRFKKENYLILTGGTTQRKDRMPLQSFYYKENSFRALFSQKSGKVTFQLEGEAGQTHNLRDNVQGSVWSSQVNISFIASKSMNITAFAGQVNSLRYTGNRYNQWMYGGGIYYNLKNNFNLYARYQNTFSPEEYYLDRNVLDFHMGYKLGRYQEINMVCRKTLVRKRKDDENLAFSVGYVLHLRAPVKKTGQTVTVSGTLHKSGNTTIDGIILHLNGHTAVSDKEGNFTFVNVRPDTYNMIVEKTSMVFGEIIDHKMPVTVNAVSGAETRIDLNIVKACRITGNLAYLDNNTRPNERQHASPFINGAVLIEITNGEDTYRKLTDSDGAFSINNLRPGVWRVNVYPSALEEGKVLEQKEFQLNLQAGEEHLLTIGVVNKSKNIRFQQEDVKIEYR